MRAWATLSILALQSACGVQGPVLSKDAGAPGGDPRAGSGRGASGGGDQDRGSGAGGVLGSNDSAGPSDKGGGAGQFGADALGGTDVIDGTAGGLPGRGGGASADAGVGISGAVSGVGGVPSGGGGTTDSDRDGSTGPALTEPVLIVTGKDSYWQTGTLTPLANGTPEIVVDENTKKQVWDGMGGTFNEVGWVLLAKLSAADQRDALNALFGADGADFVFGRVPIGATDYSVSRYTLDDVGSDTDYDMEKFSIEHDRQYLIPYIQAALAVKPGIRLWASPWTPPPWMKDNYGTDSGTMKSDDQTLDAFALYLARFVEDYGREGIAIEAVHPQNEPGYLSAYPSCQWDQNTFVKFMGGHLGPMFAQRGVSAEIWCGTMSRNNYDDRIALAVAADGDSMRYVKGFGLQWNTKGVIPQLLPRNLPIMQTEHKCGNYGFDTDYWSKSSYNPNRAPNDHAYAEESWKNIRDWVRAGVNSYNAWNMVLDPVGKNNDTKTQWPQNALIVVDEGKVVRTPAYYVFRHISRFVHAKATVVGTSGGYSDVLAFKNSDGSKVAILYNSGAATRKTTLGIGSASYQFDIPASGFVTVAVP